MSYSQEWKRSEGKREKWMNYAQQVEAPDKVHNTRELQIICKPH